MHDCLSSRAVVFRKLTGFCCSGNGTFDTAHLLNMRAIVKKLSAEMRRKTILASHTCSGSTELLNWKTLVKPCFHFQDAEF